ncbi:MAG TPA: hypothetical protein PKH35_04260 [Bacilli bacterium]|nr:hypothetical protein [Bacilli bacterium]
MKDKANIERIIKYATKIIKYMDGINTFEEFARDDEKIDAVIFNLEMAKPQKSLVMLVNLFIKQSSGQASLACEI